MFLLFTCLVDRKTNLISLHWAQTLHLHWQSPDAKTLWFWLPFCHWIYILIQFTDFNSLTLNTEGLNQMIFTDLSYLWTLWVYNEPIIPKPLKTRHQLRSYIVSPYSCTKFFTKFPSSSHNFPWVLHLNSESCDIWSDTVMKFAHAITYILILQSVYKYKVLGPLCIKLHGARE